MFREEIERINHVSEKLTELRGIFDIPTKQERISELEAEIADPEFWNQGDRAQELLKERTTLQKLVDGWTSASQTVEDLEVLVELGAESEDEATRDEVRELLPDLERQVDKMEFARMLSGEHDASNAILSINAGAGGTEAQDWADMLLRMYLRFCDIKGFKTKITDYQPGDDAGVKKCDVLPSRAIMLTAGCVRKWVFIVWCVFSPFDAASKRHTSFLLGVCLP